MNSNLKLLYVHNADFSKPFANKIQVINMCEAFFKSGVEVSLLAFGKGEKQIFNFYNIKNKFNLILLKPIGNHYFRTLQLFFKFIKIKDQFDNIFTRDLLFAYLVKTFFKNKKVIYELHDFSHKGIWKFLFKRTFDKINHLIVISNGLKEDLIKNGFNHRKITVLHDGVDLNKFDIKISKKKARKKLRIPLNKRIIVYIGSTEEERDLKTFINVSLFLKDVVFIIYGTKKRYLSNLSTNKSNVSLKKFTLMPEIVYKAADILFSGYTKKVKTIKYMSPLKVFEYMASKRPIIVADFPRTREILSNNEALFYRSEDQDDLRQKIEILLNNQQLSEELAKNAFKKAQKSTWEKRAEIIFKLLKK